MHWDQMSEGQRAAARLFADKLCKAGWEASEILDMLRAGVAVDPEGIASLDINGVRLDLKYDARTSCLLLWLDQDSAGGREEVRYQLEFLGVDNLEAILNGVIAHQRSLRPGNLGTFLGAIERHCTRMLQLGTVVAVGAVLG